MLPTQDGTGCDAFSVTVALDATQVGTTFQWGVFADLAGAPNSWVVVTEVPDPNSSQTTRSFVLAAARVSRITGLQPAADSAPRNTPLRERRTLAFASRCGRRTPRRSKWSLRPVARQSQRLHRRRWHRNRPHRSGYPHDPDTRRPASGRPTWRRRPRSPTSTPI